MSQSVAYTRYCAEADFALSRLKASREAGEAARAEHWHQAWSTAVVAAEAEAREKGGGARVARLKNAVPLRPLPNDVPPLALPLLKPVESKGLVEESTGPRIESAALPASPVEEEEAAQPPPDAALQCAMQRHAAIETALRAGGPNPLPEEMDEGEWQYHLTAFRVDGPYDCELLQAAEEAVEAIVEFLPGSWEPEEEAAIASTEGIHTGENGSPADGELSDARVSDDVPSTGQRKVTYGANVRRIVGRNPLPEPSRIIVNSPASTPKSEHTIAPAWIDAAGRTRTWSLLDPSGEKLAEIATKRDAEKMAKLLNALVSHPSP